MDKVFLKRCICYADEIYDLKDIRFLWNEEKEVGKFGITELIVAPFRGKEFVNENSDYCDDKYENQHLYRRYSCDWGNCNSEWDEISPVDVIMRMFANRYKQYLTDDVRDEALLECLKIKELRPHIIKFFNLWDSCEKK